MLNAPLARVFRRMVSRVTAPGVRSRRTVLEVTQNSLEARLAPATLVAPTVDSTTAQFVRVGPPALVTIDFLNVQTASNPQDPLRQVVVAQEERSDGKSLIIARSSIDGGTTWSTFASFGGGYQNQNIGGDGTLIGDPTIDRSTAGPETWYYTRYVEPTVTLTRDGSVYIGFRGTTTGDTAGIIGVRKYSFGSTRAAPVASGIDTGRGDGATSIIYSWAGGPGQGNPAYRPQLVSDPNVTKFTDPDTGAVLNDNYASDANNSGAVFIAYDTNYVRPAGYNGPWDPYVVYAASTYGTAKDATGNAIGGTANGGNFWTSPVRVSRSTHFEADTNAATHPVLAVSSNNSLDFTNGGYAPGQLVTTWQNPNKAGNPIGYDITNTGGFTFGGSSTAFKTLADANNATPNQSAPTYYPVTVDVAALDTTFKLSNFTVTLGIVHPNVSELQIELYRPGLDATDPLVQPTITLLRAQQVPDSTNTLPQGQGATGANLGINDKNNVIFGTTFDDNSNYAINTTFAVAPFFGTYAPDGSSLINTMKNFTPAQLNGQWTFKLRDTRNTTTTPLIQNIQFAQINITFGTGTSGAGSGFTQSNFNSTTNRTITPGGVAVATPNGTRIANAVPGSLTDAYTFLPTGLPVVQGIGPGVALAVDNSLGQTQSGVNFSPLSGLSSGHLYVAFTAAVDMNVSGTVDAADDADTFVSVYDLTRTQPLVGGPLFLYTTRLNDDAASDNMSQGLRHQYNPALAVDPKTGTLVASFYDARYDAANARFVPMLTSSIDGGLTFSAQAPASQLRVVTDVVTGKELTVEPLPSNIASANASQGIGSRPLALTVDNGRITLGFAGNPNSPGGFGYTVSARTAAGPRVIYSDVGAIGNTVVTDTVTGNSVIRPNSVQLDNPVAPNPPRFYQYNATRANGLPGVADGTPLLDGFRIVFDRRIDTGDPALPPASRVSSFNPDDVKVYFQGVAGGPPVELRSLRDAGGALVYPNLAYRIDNLSAQTTGVLSNGTLPGPIDSVGGNIVTADTDFVIRLVDKTDPTKLLPVGLVGTYSYTLSPYIRDRVRNTVAGVQRDPVTGLPTTTEVIPVSKTNGTNAPIDPVTVSYVPSGALTLSSRSYSGAGVPVSNANRPVYATDGSGLTKNLATTAITGVAVPSGTTPVSTNGVTDVPIVVQAGTFPANQDLVARAVVQVDLVNTRRGPRNQTDPLYNPYEGLILQLISPAGTVIPLVVQPGWNGATADNLGNVALPTVQEIGDGSQYDQFAFENTVFDGLAGQSLESGSGRYRGTYRPVGRIATVPSGLPFPQPATKPFPKLQDLNGQATAGTWYLRIIDNFNADNQYGQSAVNPSSLGYLRSWSLTLVPGTKTTTAYGSNTAEVTNSPRRGNFLDTNSDASSWEPLADSYSAPRPAGPLVLTNGPYSVAINNTTPLTFDPVTTRPVQTGVGIFQQGTFDKTTLPLVIGGPRVLGVATNATDGRNLNDQVYLNQAASNLYVRFDRAVLTTSAALSKVAAGLRITGPSGPVAGPFTVAAGATADELVIGFAGSAGGSFTRGGSYTVQFDASIQSTAGNAVDVNQNAGVDRLFGGNATTAAINTQQYASTAGPIPIKSAPVIATAGVQAVTGQSVAELPIPVADAFQIAQDLGRYPNARLQLNLRIQDTQTLASGEVSKLFQSLTADLVAPDGTRIRLFSGLGNALAGPGTVSTNIVFDDTALSPIGAGVNPFQTAPYNPQIPLARLLGKWSAGTWKVVVTNTLFRLNPTTNPLDPNFGQPVDVGQILSARLTLAGAFTPAAAPGGGVVFSSGLGETRADETTLGFRVYNQDPTSKESSQVWQAVGAAPSNNQANVGRVSAVTIDTADPTGNTVFAAGASGGVWKTTNFLTTDPDGPSWVPLTDFGPTTALNVASIAVFPRANPNLLPTDPLFGVNDPAYTVVFAQTGEGNSVNLPDGNTPWTKPGVGVLRSFDGGRTWSLLDSATNMVTAANKLPGETVGTILDVADSRRDHRFVGASGFKIIVDPTPYQTLAGDTAPFNRTPPNNLAVYMAVSDSRPTSDANFAGGVWRSLDSGRTWTRIGWGNATDVAFAPGAVGPDGNLQTLYLALLGAPGVTSGVYITRQATNVPAAAANTIGSLTYLLGGGGNNVIRDQLGGSNTAVGVTLQFGPFVSPTRITLATPATTNNPLANNIYQSWLYALSSKADGSVDGLFVTKDYGSNWTLVRLPEVVDAAGNFWGHNDEFQAQVAKNLVTYNATSQFTGNVAYTRDGATVDPTTGASLVDPVSGLPSGLLSDTPRTYIPRPGSNNAYGTTPRATGQGTPGANGTGGTGNRALSLAVDPLNPAVVFLGGDRSLRVDTSVIKDAQSYYYFDNTNNFPLTLLGTQASGGVTMPVVPAIAQTDALEATTSPTPWGVIVPGSANPTDTANGLATVYLDKYGLPAGFVNLSRDPSNPFLNPSVIQVYNAGSFTNSGENASLRPFDNILFGSYDVTSIVPFVDPQTGKTRLIYGTANGIYTGVDTGASRGASLDTAIGDTSQTAVLPDGRTLQITNTQVAKVVTGPRNGNLQIGQYYQGAVQPSRLAADIAGALFYAVSQDNGYPVSSSDVIETGNTAQRTGDWPGTGLNVATDQTGTGTAYQYRLPSSTGTDTTNTSFGNVTDFFRLQLPGADQSASGIGRSGNLLVGQNPFNNQGDWPLNDTRYGTFAVNSLDGAGIVISAAPFGASSGGSAQVYRSIDRGLSWQNLGSPLGTLGFPQYVSALAFGGPDANFPSQRNNYILAGTGDASAAGYTTGGSNGQVYFTVNGTLNSWVRVPGDSATGGHSILKIVPNPRFGSSDFYALTDRQVFYVKMTLDRTNPAGVGATWTDVTGNLYSITRTLDSFRADSTGLPLPDTAPSQTTVALKDVTGKPLDLTSLAVDWRYTNPVLYVAGEGGTVFRTVTFNPANPGSPKNWTAFPDNPAGSYADGGYLPNVRITDLDLSLGVIDQTYDPANPGKGGMPLLGLDPTTGLPKSGGALNLLVATTYGRGQFVTRINPTEVGTYVPDTSTNPPGAVIDPIRPDAFVSGPRVSTIANITSSSLTVVFDAPVDPVTFSDPADDVILKDSTGARITVTSIKPVPAVPGQPDPRNRYVVTFPAQATAGFYYLQVGNEKDMRISDLAGNRMNQNGNLINGETFTSPNGDDTFNTFVFLNGQAKSLLVTGLTSKLSVHTPTTFTVRAINADGTTDTTFAGPVTFTSTDPNVLLSASSGAGTIPTAPTLNYNFGAGDLGQHAFTVTFRSGAAITDAAGNLLKPVDQLDGFFRTILVDAQNPLYNDGKVGSNIFNARVQRQTSPTSLNANLPAQVSAWDPQATTANVVDYNGNRLPAFGGIVSVSSSDPAALLPTPQAYTPLASNGTADFSQIILRTGDTLSAGGKPQTLTYTGGVADGVDPLTVPTNVVNAKLAVTGFYADPATGKLRTSTYDPQSLTVTVTSALTGKALTSFNQTVAPEAVVNVKTDDDTTAVVSVPNIQYAATSAGVGATKVMFLTKGSPTRTVTLSSAVGVDTNTLTSDVVNAQFQLTGFPAKVSTWNPQAVTVAVVSPITTKVLPFFSGGVAVSSTDERGAAVKPDSSNADPLAPVTPTTSQTYNYDATSTGSRVQTLLFRTGSTLSTGGLDQSVTFAGPAGVDAKTATAKVVNAVFRQTGLPDKAANETATAGQGVGVTVAVGDPLNGGATLKSFVGTVTLGTDDTKATITPNPFTYTALNNGAKSFVITYRTSGDKSFTADTNLGKDSKGNLILGVDPLVTDAIVLAADASKFTLTGTPTTVTASQANNFVATLTATDPFGNPASGYTGTVVLSSSDKQAGGLPVTYTFVAADKGSHSFDIALRTAGTQQIIASEQGGTGLSASQTGITVLPSVASQFTLFGYPTQTTAGDPHPLVLKASDAFGNTASNFTGTVTFTTTDLLSRPGNSLGLPSGIPADFTFTAADQGQKVFSAVELRTAGPQSITATSGAISSTQGGITVVAAPASTFDFSITAPAGPPYVVPAGGQVSFSLVAKDRFANTDSKYAGTVQFSSSDLQANLPNTYTFNANDGGIKQFSPATLKSTGTQTITAKDAVSGAVGSSKAITVQPAAAGLLNVAGFPPAVPAGATNGFSVTLFDGTGNVAVGFTGTISFASSDPTAVFALASAPTVPITSYTFTAADAGTRQFVAALTKAGLQTLTVTPTTDPLVNSGTVSTTVQAAAVTSFRVGEFPSPANAGSPQLVRVTALDQFGNTADNYTGLVRLTSSDPAAVLPPQSKLTNGAAFFLVTLNTAGSQSITASDTLNPAVLGSQTGITVTGSTVPPTPTPPTGSTIPPVTVTAGSPTVVPFTVTTFPLGTGPDGLVYTATSSNPALVPQAGLVFGGSGPARTLTVTSAAGLTGAATITLSITDPATNLFSTQQFGLTVNPVPPPPPPPPGSLTNLLAVGSDIGVSNRVTVYNPDGSVLNTLQPFAAGFTFGTRVATVRQADGKQLIAAVPGPGRQTEVKVLDPYSGATVVTLPGFEDSFQGGLFVAAGDVNGDGVDDIAISPDQGGGGRVRVFDGRTYAQLADYFGIDDPSFRGGARVTFGDLNGDGRSDLIVAAGFGGGPRVALFDGRTVTAGRTPEKFVGDFFVFEQSLRNGVFVAAGDVAGKGYADLVVAGGPGGGPRVYALDGKALLSGQFNAVANFFAGDPDSRGGVRVTVKNLDGDKYQDIVAGDGVGSGTKVRTYFGADILKVGNNALPVLGSEFEELPGSTNGVFVG